jgi:hypothetical protein
MSQTKAQLLNPLGEFELTGQLVGVGATFSGNVSIAGTLTKQDVTNVDAVGLITARSGINVTGGSVIVGYGGAGANNAELKLRAGAGTGNDIIAFLNQAGTTKGNITYDTDNNFLLFNVNSGEKLRIDSNGGVKIGSGDATGIHNLAKVLEIAGGDGGDLIIGNDASSNIGAGAHIGALAFKNIDNSTGSSPHYAGIRCESVDTSGNMDLRFYTGTANLEADLPQLLINSGGDVGIGTVVPGSPLEVNGGSGLNVATFNSHHAQGVLINLQRSGTNIGYLGSGKNIADATGGVDDIGLRSQANLIFTSGGGTERLRIGTSGQLGIAGANYGTAGQVLASGGSGAAPSWTTISAAPEVEGTASGAITAHKSCVVNANGTISQVLQTTTPATTTNQDTELTNDGTYFPGDVKWLSSDKFIMMGRKINDSNKGRYFFGSVTSGGAITLTNSAMWTGNYNEAWNTRIAIDSSTNKVMALTQLDGDNAIYMRAGEVNSGGTDIDWESANWWGVGSGQKTSTIATDNNGGYMIAYRRTDNNMHFRHVQLNASGSPQDVSSEASWTYYNTNNGDYANGENKITMDYVPSVGAYWCVMEDYNRFYYNPNGIWLSGGGYFRACWVKSNGTGSAPTLTLANQTVFGGAAGSQSAATANSMGYDPRFVYDPTSGKGILAYRPSHTTSNGKALVLSFTDTSAQPTYTGTGVEVTQNSCDGLSVTVSTGTNMKKVVFYSSETGNTLIRSFEVSGTTLVGVGNTINIFPGQHYQYLVIDSNNFNNSIGRFITMTQDEGNGDYLSASAVDFPIVDTNLTDENFIGFAADSYADTATAKVKVVGNTSTQSGLTTAQKYYVKWDGTLSTAPDPQGAPSVTAGRALSATSLLIQPA